MADQVNISGPVEIESDCNGRVAFDMIKYYSYLPELEGKKIEDVAKVFALFMKIMKNPYNSNAYINSYSQKRDDD